MPVSFFIIQYLFNYLSCISSEKVVTLRYNYRLLMDSRLHISAFSPDSLNEVRQIYLESFPPEERRDFDDIILKASSADCPLHLDVITDRGSVLGLISWWDFGCFIYVEHFAVAGHLRSAGIGSEVLKQFLVRSPLPVVLEVERPGANEMADRRIGFYRRNGFTPLSDYDYIQPPYSPGQPSVPLLLMSTDAALDPENIARTLHHQVYGR